VFYRGERALVTQQFIETVHVRWLRYTLDELSGICVVQCDREPQSAARVMGLSALAASLLVVPIVSPASHVVAGLTAGVFAVGGVLHMRRRVPVRWELVATYRGEPTVLFESENQTEFDQVCRGLTRALERQHRSR
jgi:hypothetical protein